MVVDYTIDAMKNQKQWVEKARRYFFFFTKKQKQIRMLVPKQTQYVAVIYINVTSKLVVYRLARSVQGRHLTLE